MIGHTTILKGNGRRMQAAGDPIIPATIREDRVPFQTLNAR
jgi:hypothetical protein